MGCGFLNLEVKAGSRLGRGLWAAHPPPTLPCPHPPLLAGRTQVPYPAGTESPGIGMIIASRRCYQRRTNLCEILTWQGLNLF